MHHIYTDEPKYGDERKYKPNNENYEFFILRPFSEKLLIKINRLIKNV